MIEARGQGYKLKCAMSVNADFGVQEQAAFKAQVSGVFKVMYGVWAREFTERILEVSKF